jgi:membrane protease YdiL (CAAX protease family)
VQADSNVLTRQAGQRELETAIQVSLTALAGLGAATLVRWKLSQTGAVSGLFEGLLFGVALLLTARLAGERPARPPLRSVAAGAAAALLLVAASLLARWPQAPLQLGHAAPFGPWLAVTALVASAEELVLRGALWRGVAAALGEPSALAVTSVAFALIHLPVYGQAVLPVDLAAGLFLGGLRLVSRGTTAPAAAHVLADVATWWL